MINRFSIITGILLLMASCQSKEKAEEQNTEVEKATKVSIAEIEAGDQGIHRSRNSLR
jgi:predicted outer membrane protein